MDNIPIFVVSRFNMPLSPKSMDGAWLNSRLEPFAKFTVPALAAQSDADFTWLVVVQPGTPEHIIAAIDAAKSSVPQLRVMYAQNTRAAIRKLVAECDNERVITVRLDTDDMVSRDFIALIRRNLRGKRLRFLNFDHGLVYDCKSESLYRRTYLYSPFIAVLEPRGNIRGIYAYNHCAIHLIAPVKHLRLPPHWLQVVHGGNWMNKIQGLPVKKELLNGFPNQPIAPPVNLTPSQKRAYFKALLTQHVTRGIYRVLRFVKPSMKYRYITK